MPAVIDNMCKSIVEIPTIHIYLKNFAKSCAKELILVKNLQIEPVSHAESAELS